MLFDSLFDQSLKFVLLHTRLAQLTDNYGVTNALSATHNLKKIQELYFKDTIHKSESVFLADQLKSFDSDSVSVDDIRFCLKKYFFSILTEKFELNNIQKLNQYLAFFECKFMIYYEFSSGMDMLIFSKGKRSIYKKQFSLLQMKDEVIKTFNVVDALVASTSTVITMVREHAMQQIFQQKWVVFFRNQHTFSYNDFYVISSAIKQKVISLYDSISPFNSNKTETLFIKDMSENVLNHEVGHLIAQSDVFEIEHIALCVSTEMVKETIFMAMWEVFADFAPQINDNVGCMKNICNIAKKDEARANRLFYMYLSDVWFYDTADEYMFLYSDLMFLILLKYINEDQSIDYKGLEADLMYRKTRTDIQKLSLVERVFELFSWSVQEIKLIAERAEYNFQVDNTFSYLVKVMKKISPQYAGPELKDNLQLQKTFWMNVVGYLKLLSEEGYKELNQYIDTQEKKILKKMMILSCGKKKAESYGYDHRKYIVDRMKALGFDGQ